MTDEERKEMYRQSDEVTAEAAAKEKETYDFDDALPDTGDGEFTLLPAGNYHFKVIKQLRGWMDHGKCQGAKTVTLTVKVFDDEGNAKTWDELLILHKNIIHKVRQFFRSIGQPVEEGKPFRPDWSQVPGASGECEIEVNEFTSSKTGKQLQNNRVKRWLAPSEDFESF